MNPPHAKNRENTALSPWRMDLVAGLSVAVLAIPQGIAYALVAEVPAQYGIYTVIVHGLLGVLLNHNGLMAVGPTNTQSLLVASIAMHVLGGSEYDDPAARGQAFLGLAVSLGFLKGVIQLMLAGLRMGVLARYFSRSVILGFTAGAGTLIALGQLSSFLGLPRAEHVDGLPSTYVLIAHVLESMSEISLPCVTIGLVTITILVGCRMKSPLIPGALIALVVTSIGSAAMAWGEGSVPCVSWSEGAAGPWVLPEWSLGNMERLLGGAFALSVLGMVETYSISRSVASRGVTAARPDREMAAQGVIHIIGSFFSCIPGSGSFARSAMNVYAGARSRYAAGIGSAAVAVVFFAGAPLLQYVPLPMLAGQLIVIGYRLANWQAIGQILRASRADGLVVVFTFFATLLLPLHYAIFAGVLLNLGIYLRCISRLHIQEVTPRGEEGFEERELRGAETLQQRDLVMIQLQGDLYFGMDDELGTYLDRIVGFRNAVTIIRLKGTKSMDTTVMYRLGSFVSAVQSHGGHVICCGVSRGVRARMERYGLVAVLGAGNTLEAGETILESSRAAVARARELESSDAAVR